MTQPTETGQTVKLLKRIGLIVLALFVALLGVVLSIENRSPTSISLWLFETPELPLVVWLVVVFLFGLLVGSSISFFVRLREKWGSRKKGT